MKIILTNDKINADYAMSQKGWRKNEVAITFKFKDGNIGIYNRRDIGKQVDIWNRDCFQNNYEMRSQEYNKKTFTAPDGKKWYVLIAQVYTNGEMDEEKNHSCPLSLFLFNTMVDGYTYAFTTEKMRDNVSYAINKKMSLTSVEAFKLVDAVETIGVALDRAKKIVETISSEAKLVEKLEKEEDEVKPLSKKEQAKLKAAEARAEAKAEKKRRDDYLKAIGKFKTPEQIKKEKEARLKTEVAMMRK